MCATTFIAKCLLQLFLSATSIGLIFPGAGESYVEFDFAPLPRTGEGTYKLQITILTADKDIKLSEPAVFGRKEGDPAANCETIALFLNKNRFKAEVVGKTKLRVYGRIWNDTLIPATKGMVESTDLRPEELPKVKNPATKG